MTFPSNALEIDTIVCRAVGKRPGESIVAACRRIMAAPKGNPAWRVAREILSGRGEPWSRMRRAAKIARRSGCSGPWFGGNAGLKQS